MNAVEIEQAVSDLAGAPFDPAEFPFAFLEAFGNKPATLKKLRKGESNKSDVGGVLQRGNIHLKACPAGEVPAALAAVKASPATARQKAKFVLATDGLWLEAERLTDGMTCSCGYADFGDHFGMFLPLAGISTVKAIDENAFDIRATGHLNRLYVELRKDNPEWDAADRRAGLNHFFARLIFCFFAEDTGIFHSKGLFTNTVLQMAAPDSSNTHEVIAELFRAMNTPLDNRTDFRVSAKAFPYVNGNLFDGPTDVPRFSRIAKSYLRHIGGLDWTKINPDIFGSMIQAVADDEERGALGMHYTSVPNILKVLNPLFLDDLRRKLAEAGDGSTPASKGRLKRLRDRLARVRVFDPACGSGNFLVIAYKEMRAIEADINQRRGNADGESVIPLTNFRGIELRHFAAEIARLALIIAEFQCDALYRGHRQAVMDFLPLSAENWITCGNALRLDWLGICPPEGPGDLERTGSDLFNTPLDQPTLDFENEGGETYICGNPPYQGSVNQTTSQKDDMRLIFGEGSLIYKDLDYVAAFVYQAARYNRTAISSSAFVTTNSITQGEQVAMLWPRVFGLGNRIFFAHKSFQWSNLASNKAAVTCVIVGLSCSETSGCTLFSDEAAQTATCIGPYLVKGSETIVQKLAAPIHALSRMDYGNKPTDGGNLILSEAERENIIARSPESTSLIRRYMGSREFINSIQRYCLWIEHTNLVLARQNPEIGERLERVRKLRSESRGTQANQHASTPHRFVFTPHTDNLGIVVPRHFSSNRRFLTVGVVRGNMHVIADSASAIYDAELVDLAVLSSTIHMVWVDTVAGRIKYDYRYSSTLVWNTFPVPPLSDQNRADLTRCAEGILLAREAHFPATIADMYDPDRMKTEFPDLRAAHDRNDETLERIYIGRRFKNDTERLEKLFAMYTEMTAKQASPKKPAPRKTKRADA